MGKEKKLIEDIKKEYLSEKDKKQTTIKSMWAQYQKMANELSEGIYAEDNHFIYELIQNAEDTISKGKEHILEFTLEDDGLIVFNNEVGFTDEQIKAICSFGQSTKALEKNEGFIGEKGIGFKSVFKITDKPAIFSNGYRFYFNRLDETGETEYIIPHWIDDNELKNYPLKFQKNTHTTLYLPFSKEKKQEKIDKLKKDIKHIEPILLLFLKKLTSIKINESDTKVINTKKTSKKDEQLSLVKIQNEDVSDKYYIFNKSIDVDQNLDEVKDKNGRRKEIKKREIILAFPNFKNETKEDRVFSFLPTKLHSELNFIIQADFILQSGRENIAIDSEWNRWQFEEIEEFICNEIVDKLKAHSKLKFSYLEYFLKNGDSHNELVETLYKNIIDTLKEQKSILSDNNTWQKPNNILLLEDNIQIDTKYLKLLFGENYEQLHLKFKLDELFINRFGIKKVGKKEIIEKICNYFDKKDDLNSYDKDIVLNLTKFLAKNLNTDSRALTYEKNLFERVKKSLPIIPKYKTNKKFYLFDAIYISSEYKPKFLIENIAKEDKFDFTEYNFLSDDYLEDKRLTDFIKNIVDEQEKDNHKKTIEFFTKYPNILQGYLKNNITERYKKIFDYLLKIQEDNKNKISKIPLLLVQNGNFYDATHTIYFSNNGEDNNLDVLNKSLFELVQQKHEYKEFLEKVFKVKEADIINMILDQYLLWIKENQQHRNTEHDEKLIKYTKDIIENFDKFDPEEKQKIKKALYFISSNQKKKYLKSNSIYLPQNLTEIIFNNNSIEKYITDKSYFNFLDNKYNQIFENLNEKKLKSFFNYFDFKQYLKEDDISNFIKNIKKDLDLEHNIDALEFIVKSMEYSNIDKLKKFKVYTNKKGSKKEIQAIFFEQVENFDIDYLHEDYRKKIKDLDRVKQYFQSPYDIECFIDYLKQDISFNKAVEVYKYLDYKSEFNPNKQQSENFTITPQKIRKLFKDNELIYNKQGEKFCSEDVTWREEKSSNQTFALSTIYPKELENFFIKKVQVSQSKDIRQIVNKIKVIKERSDDYFDLLIDLNGLINEESELDKYYDSFDNNTPLVKDKYVDLKKFIAEKEQIFILDSGKKNNNSNFYFNDLEISDYDEKLKSKIFSVNDRYPVNHYSTLINSLNIERLSSFEKSYENWSHINKYDIENYRKMLEFAYDLLFTKFPEQYKGLESRESELKELNLVNTINIYEDIISQIAINDTKIKLDSITSYFKNNELNIINENDLFKIVAGKIGHISEDSIEMFYDKVIAGFKSQEEYYKEKHITKKQGFVLEISNVVEDGNQQEEGRLLFEDNDNADFDEDYDSSQDTIESSMDKKEDELSAEEKRKKRLLKDALIDDQSNGDTDFFSIANNNETIIIDDDLYCENIHNENINNPNRIISATTNYKKQNVKEIKKIEEFLYKEYEGHCQVCGDTFTDGFKNVFKRKSLNTGKNRDISRKGNSLCLCFKHHEIFKRKLHKYLFLDYIPYSTKLDLSYVEKQFKKYDFVGKEDINRDKDAFYMLNDEDDFMRDDVYFFPIQLFGKKEYIKFTKAHMMEFIEVWNEN